MRTLHRRGGWLRRWITGWKACATLRTAGTGCVTLGRLQSGTGFPACVFAHVDSRRTFPPRLNTRMRTLHRRGGWLRRWITGWKACATLRTAGTGCVTLGRLQSDTGFPACVFGHVDSRRTFPPGMNTRMRTLHRRGGWSRRWITVAPDKVTADFVRSYLPEQESFGQKNHEVAFSYSIRPGKRRAETPPRTAAGQRRITDARRRPHSTCRSGRRGESCRPAAQAGPPHRRRCSRRNHAAVPRADLPARAARGRSSSR